MTSGVRWWRWDDPVGPLRRHLEAGGVVAIPTESSYGLAALPSSRRGVEAIYAVKRREAGKPLPVVAADLEQLAALGVDTSSEGVRLAAGRWPAPLSVVAPLAAPLPASAGARTLAVRVPAHRRLRQLLAALGTALTATSANRTGEPPILDPRHLAPLLSRYHGWMVDGGVLHGGPPSTLVERSAGRWRLLRPGAFPEAELPEPKGRAGDEDDSSADA